MAERDKRVVYQIKVRGKLDERWSDWFSGLRVVTESESPPITTLVGSIDQAGLRGVLNKLWDLNLTLVSVNRIREGESVRRSKPEGCSSTIESYQEEET
jgi:hypothetical protein